MADTKSVKWQGINDVFAAVTEAINQDAGIEAQIDLLTEARQTRALICGSAWAWLTAHADAVKSAGYSSATDAINQRLGKDGANRFFNRVNAYKKSIDAPKGKNSGARTTETAFSRLIKRVKALSLKELQDLQSVISAAITDIDAASAAKTTAKRRITLERTARADKARARQLCAARLTKKDIARSRRAIA